MTETIAPPVLTTPPAALSQVKPATSRKERMVYIDNIRLWVIINVILLHIAITFSGMGRWYYNEHPLLDPISFSLFGIFQTINQAYFMGLLFLIAAYFIPGAYDRKGFGRFLKDRAIRLGVPTLIYMLLANPFIDYVLLGAPGLYPKPSFWQYYAGFITGGYVLSASGPSWFSLALLFFSLIYAVVRLVVERLRGAKLEKLVSTAPVKVTSLHLIGLILVIAVGAFLIRLVYPIGTSVLNMQLCYFSAYIVLFLVGLFAYRRNLHTTLDTRLGLRWFYSALYISPISLGLVMFLGGGFSHGPAVFNGGLNWQSAIWAIWESYTAVALSVGLLTLFRERYNHQSRLVKILSDSSFAVYVFHAPLLVAITLCFQSVDLHPLVKSVLSALVAVPACYAMAFYILKRIPLLKTIL